MLYLSAHATIGGVALKAGRYVLMTVPRQESWTILFFTTTATDPAAIFQTLTDVGQGVGAVERLDRPIEMFTIRAEEYPLSPAILIEWDLIRVRVPVARGP
jgi:hypothetical protein